MLNMGCQLTIKDPVLESADSGLESSNSGTDFSTNPLKKLAWEDRS